VHAEHSEPFRGGSGKGAKAHQGRGDGRTGQRDQLAQALACSRAGIDDAAAGVEDRPRRLGEHGDGGIDRALVGLPCRTIAGVEGGLPLRRRCGGDLDILGQVDDDGAGAAGRGEMEGFPDGLADLGGSFTR
jgi:hypothetical protein